MATWPESNPTPIYPLNIIPRFDTIISQFDAGGEQRRSRRDFPVFDVIVSYRGITSAEANTLYTFFLERKGRYEAFVIYDLALLENISQTHTKLYVGTGDGSTDIFDIPGRSTSSRTLYVNDSVQGSGFSYLTGGGDGNSDRVDFTSPPAAGNVITITFTGFLRCRVRFESDNLDKALFMKNLYAYNGIKLAGVEAIT